jgi:hypothetical protein
VRFSSDWVSRQHCSVRVRETKAVLHDRRSTKAIRCGSAR